MVLEFQFRRWRGLPALACAVFLMAGQARAAAPDAGQAFKDSETLFGQGQYFESARYAFSALEADESRRAEAYSRITLALSRAGLPNAAAYFFIRTLQTQDASQIRRALGETESLLTRVGGDLLRPYLIRHTQYEDYDAINRSAYLYSLGKDAVLSEDHERAIGYLSAIQPKSALWPYALQLRASSFAILGKDQQALSDFRACRDRSGDAVSALPQTVSASRRKQVTRETEDLRSRCQAGEARTLYQMERFEEADRAYDRIPKASFVWPDILFEQAWNSFGRQEYNRALGKLVSYKSPALKFVYNSEVDVLRAQSFLALCLYSDANDVLSEFAAKHQKLGEEVKSFVESNSSNLSAFYDLGARALKDSLYTSRGVHRMANRFVRGPYFQGLVASTKELAAETATIHEFSAKRKAQAGQGLAGFLEQVLGWRARTIRLLGGAFVKNSLIDYHEALISDFEKMSFIKLEMLKRAKDQILKRPTGADRTLGNLEPSRRDDQYYWSFNGEFWNDEIGDYVFGLESQCSPSS